MGTAPVVPVRKQETGLGNLVKDFKKKEEERFDEEKENKESITNVCDSTFVILCAELIFKCI